VSCAVAALGDCPVPSVPVICDPGLPALISPGFADRRMVSVLKPRESVIPDAIVESGVLARRCRANLRRVERDSGRHFSARGEDTRGENR